MTCRHCAGSAGHPEGAQNRRDCFTTQHRLRHDAAKATDELAGLLANTGVRVGRESGLGVCLQLGRCIVGTKLHGRRVHQRVVAAAHALEQAKAEVLGLAPHLFDGAQLVVFVLGDVRAIGIGRHPLRQHWILRNDGGVLLGFGLCLELRWISLHYGCRQSDLFTDLGVLAGLGCAHSRMGIGDRGGLCCRHRGAGILLALGLGHERPEIIRRRKSVSGCSGCAGGLRRGLRTEEVFEAAHLPPANLYLVYHC